MGLSTHILDTSLGRPAAGVALALAVQRDDGWQTLGTGVTDADGRCRTLLGDQPLQLATYRLRFETKPYFTTQILNSLYPFVEIAFDVTDADAHYHIPLLISPNGFTTYRGS